MDNSTPNNADKLVQYLDGELNETERASLEAELATNKELASELENFQLAKQVVRKYGVKNQVANIHASAMKQQPLPKIGQRTRLLRYVAAAAAAILILFAINLYTKSSNSPEKLFAENYVTYQLNTSRGNEPAQDDEIEKAFQAKDYQTVAKASNENLTIKDQFLKGAAFTELGNNQAAVDNFLKLILRNAETKTTLFNDDAEYYLSLVYLRMHEYPKSIDLLEKIKADTAHTYNARVTDELLKRVKALK